MIVTLVIFYYACAKSFVAEKIVCRGGRTRILTDSARKKTGKKLSRIIIKQELT